MAGFLDKNDRIIDMVLTGEGKHRLSLGKLSFAYWVPFDDEIDYSPFIALSGSMDAQSLSSSISEQIEASPIREVTTGYKRFNRSGVDPTNVRHPIFTMNHGQKVLPAMDFESSSGSDFHISVKQTKLYDLYIRRDSLGNVSQQLGPFDRGYSRYDSSVASIVLKHDGFPPDHRSDGFLVKVLTSGSEGFFETNSNRDLNNEISFDDDLLLVNK